MNEPNTLDEQIRKAVKDGLSNHTGEFANPWVFKKSYSHEELADILNDVMANERLFKNLSALFTEHSKEVDRLAREIFVPVKGAEGFYEVSNTGKVRSVAGGRRSGKELAQSIRSSKTGYYTVSFCKKGKTMSANVHRLVASAFLSNPENKKCVNHIDGNKQNNDVSNLEWATYQENERHSFDVLGKQPHNKGEYKEICKWGHPLSGDNLMISKAGQRKCRACGRKFTNEYRAQLKRNK